MDAFDPARLGRPIKMTKNGHKEWIRKAVTGPLKPPSLERIELYSNGGGGQINNPRYTWRTSHVSNSTDELGKAEERLLISSVRKNLGQEKKEVRHYALKR